MAKILVIEDEENLRFSIRQSLRRAGHDVAEAPSASRGLELCGQADFDCLLTDVNLGGESGIDAVKSLRSEGFEGGIIVMTAYGSVQNAVEAMKAGADDYLQKPLSLEELGLLIERLLIRRRERTRLRLYERVEQSRARSESVLGESETWKQAVRIAERLAAVPLPSAGGVAARATGGALPTVLLIGETGTGKGVLARHIHEFAERSRGEGEQGKSPLVHVNCAALPATLIESELFGHEKGAFTDAKGVREGLFEMAEGGTVFLDEIGDMPLELQAKLLTVVEDGTFRRVGGTRDKRARARVITATNQDLEKRAEDGRFRRDLLYRLNAFTIALPPLRDRRGDAASLASEMLARFARLYGRPAISLSAEALSAIDHYHWPGNVRELINVMQRAAMFAERRVIEPVDLNLPAPAAPAGPLRPAPPNAANSNAATAGGLVFDFDHGVHLAEDVERELILQALRRAGGNVSKAAKLIGMQRSSLRYRVERLKLEGAVKEISQP